MLNESRKILEHPELRCSVTCVRVPVLRSHAVAIHLETEAPLELDAVRSALGSARGVTLEDDPKAGRYPTPLSAAGQDEVCVGRIRRDMSHKNGIALWVAGDQLLKGAALNAVQCAEVAFSIGAFDDASIGALA